VTGLSKLQDDFNFSYILLNGALTIDWNLDIPAVALNGEYAMDLVLDLGSQHSVSGMGNLSISMEAVLFKLHAKGLAPASGKMGVTDLEVDIGFEDFKIEFSNSYVDNSTLINWENQSGYIKRFFESLWTDESRPLITEMVRCSVDYIVNVRSHKYQLIALHIIQSLSKLIFIFRIATSFN